MPDRSIQMVFERRTPSESQIVAKRFGIDGNSWDSTETVISSSPWAEMQTRPDYAERSYASSTTSHVNRLAVWQRWKDQRWQLFYSMRNDSQKTWTPPSLLLADSMNATDARVVPYNDSLFLVTWKRANAVVAVHVSCCSAVSPPETLAVSSSDTIQYDVCLRSFGGGVSLVWTSGSPPDIMVLFRSNYAYGAGGWSPPETTLTQLASLPSPHLFVSFGTPWFLYEQGWPMKQDVLLWTGGFPNQSFNISQDSSSVNVNARALQLPVLTKPASNLFPGSYPLDVCVYEKYRGTDSLLVFLGYNRSDTVRSMGHNRNVCVGSQLWSGQGWLHILIVWESNRSGRSHIYSKLATLMYDNVDASGSSPSTFMLYPNYPNPFNPSTTISFEMPAGGNATLKVFDTLGQEVRTLIDGPVAAGRTTMVWNSSDHSGRPVASGVYFYSLNVWGAGRELYSTVKKMLLLR